MIRNERYCILPIYSSWIKWLGDESEINFLKFYRIAANCIWEEGNHSSHKMTFFQRRDPESVLPAVACGIRQITVGKMWSQKKTGPMLYILYSWCLVPWITPRSLLRAIAVCGEEGCYINIRNAHYYLHHYILDQLKLLDGLQEESHVEHIAII